MKIGIGSRAHGEEEASGCLLYVDDRPTTLTDALLAREDVNVVLLRFEEAKADLPPFHLEATRDVPAFTVDSRAGLANEAERFDRWQRDLGLRVRYFCNPSEPRQAVSHRFARLLALPALSEKQVAWVREKPVMKERLTELGISVAAFDRICSARDVEAFGQTHGWPVVVKPVDSYACIDTFAVPDRAAARELSLAQERSWMVESFVFDEEWECCALVFNGIVLDVYLSYFPAPPLAATDGDINANISVGGLPTGFPVDVVSLVQQIVTGMSLRDGYLHMEMFVGRDGLCTVSEVGFRLAGCEIPANHGLALGFDIFGALIDIHLGRLPSLSYSRRRCVGDLLLPLPSGTIEHVTEIEELIGMEGVIGGRLRVRPGDRINRRRASHTSAGFVHVEGATPAEVELRMRAVLHRFEIVVAEEAPRTPYGEQEAECVPS